MKKYTLLLVCALFCSAEVGAIGDPSEDADDVAADLSEEASKPAVPAVNSDETDAFLDALLAMLVEGAERDPVNNLPLLIQFVKFLALSNVEHLDSRYIRAVIVIISSHLSGLPNGDFKKLLQNLRDILSKLVTCKASALNEIESGKASKEHPFSELGDPLLAMVFAMSEYVNPERLEKLVHFCRNVCGELKDDNSKEVRDSVSKLNKISSALEDLVNCVNNLREQRDRVEEAINKGITLDKYPDMDNLKKAAEATDNSVKTKK
ncbi:MAG: hypothetical protein LBJ96_01640 [Holosporaceae bacterium]|jgi:hypothetical protein|nr:hypothetical protein [Holosporaceae bacterium]